MKLTWSGLNCPCKIKIGNIAILAKWKYNIGVALPASRGFCRMVEISAYLLGTLIRHNARVQFQMNL